MLLSKYLEALDRKLTFPTNKQIYSYFFPLYIFKLALNRSFKISLSHNLLLLIRGWRGRASRWSGGRGDQGVLGLRQEDHGALPAQGAGLVLARRLSQVRLLRLPSRRGRLHTLHESESHTLQKRLFKVRFISF